MELLSDDSFVRWIHGEASPSEQEKWETWRQADANHQKWTQQARHLYQLPFYQIDEGDQKDQLHRLQGAIDEDKSKKVDRWPRDVRRARRRNWTTYAAVASLILILGLTFFYYQDSMKKATEPHYVTVHTDYGQKDSLIIRDGSVIILNSNSTLRYNPKTLAEADTKLYLESGEAYFSIVHNPDRTLQVLTDNGIVEDIGTKFNVNTRNGITRVALNEGKVRILKKNQDSDTNTSYSAHPGELIKFSASQKNIEVNKENLEVYTSWIQNKMVFDDTPFRDIVKKIEDTYGVEIVVRDKELMKRKVSGSIRSPNLKIVLKGLAQTMGLTIKHKGNKILINIKSNRNK